VAVYLPNTAVADQKPKADAKAKADPARPAELKVLDRWVGRWDMEVTIKPGAWVPAGSKGKFVATTAWDLNNRFIRSDAKGQTERGDQKGDAAFMWICTWDPQRGEYRNWVFWSNAATDDSPAGIWGGNPVASSTWDEATKTLTTKMEDKEAGITSQGVTRWIDDDHHEFTATIKDAAGDVLMEQSGKVSRRK
jgi:hypothetical protein